MPLHRTQHVDPTADIAWAPGEFPEATLYLLDGRTHLVARHSLAERRLQERGAFPVAVLTFDHPVTRRLSEAPSEPLRLGSSAGQLLQPARN